MGDVAGGKYIGDKVASETIGIMYIQRESSIYSGILARDMANRLESMRTKEVDRREPK